MSNAARVARSLLSGIVVLTALLGFAAAPATADSRALFALTHDPDFARCLVGSDHHGDSRCR